jgi:hypothetical protein
LLYLEIGQPIGRSLAFGRSGVYSKGPPAASGWSDYRVGLSPTGKRRILTAHTRKADIKQV